MCVDAELVSRARRAADAIARDYFRLPIEKAMDLSTPGGFDQALAGFAAAMRGEVKATEDAAVRAAVKALDVDWHGTTAEQRRTLVAKALDAVGRHTKKIPDELKTTFDQTSKELVQATRDSVRKDQKLGVSTSFNAVDKRVIDHLRTSEAGYVRDEYGRRHAVFSKKARDIVGRGLEQGHGRADIAEELKKAAEGTIGSKHSSYWEMVAGSFMTRGRSFAQMSSYAEAGMDRYLIEAVLDEATTETCRYLHGKAFSVQRSLQMFSDIEKEPENIARIAPWIREGVDDKGRQTLFVRRPNGNTRRIATVDKPGMGTKERGSYSMGMTGSRLQEVAPGFPPFHGLCRSSTVADVSANVVTPRVASAAPKPKTRRDGPLELLAQSKTFGSSSGQALSLDSDFVENFDVQFRAERIGGKDITKVRFKVTDQRAESVRAAILKGTRASRSEVYRHQPGGFDPKTGKIVKRGEDGPLRFGAVGGSFGKARVRMVTDKGALTNFVEMDIPTGNAKEAFKAYGEVTKKLGISEAVNFPSAESLDVLRKARLITQYDRAGWEKVRKLKELTPGTVGPIFRKAEKRFPELKKVAGDAKLMQTAKGHIALHSKSQADRLRKDGIKGVFHDLSDPDMVVKILTDPDGSGLVASTQRYSRGLIINGMSTSTDFGTGGADGVFTRVVSTHLRHLQRGGGARVMIDTDQLGRSDWYFFNKDNFGRAGPAQYGERKLVPEMKTTAKGLSRHNEMIFQHGIPQSAIRGVVIDSPTARSRIIAELRRAGVTKVNGKPIESFITDRESY